MEIVYSKATAVSADLVHFDDVIVTTIVDVSQVLRHFNSKVTSARMQYINHLVYAV